MSKELGLLLDKVREKKPLVHHITNYVTVNDCANITLAVGASPVMADDICEAADITAIADSLVINIGTLNERTILSMIASGKAANAKGVPVVLDPVGAGASKFRNDTAKRIIDEIKLSVLRGNISEIKFMAGLGGETKGVDASESDMENNDDAGQIAKNLAKKLGCVVVISGAVDTISDGSEIAYVENGHAMLSGLTGTGCMCSSLIGAFCGSSPENIFTATTAAMVCMGVAGEDAYKTITQKSQDNRRKQGSFHIALRDAVSSMDGEYLQRQAKIGGVRFA